MHLEGRAGQGGVEMSREKKDGALILELASVTLEGMDRRGVSLDKGHGAST